jgi:hypothetical protein
MSATLKLTHKAIGAEVRSSLDVTPCKFAMDETRAALKLSTPPRKRSSPSDAQERGSCRSFSHPLSCRGWH